MISRSFLIGIFLLVVGHFERSFAADGKILSPFIGEWRGNGRAPCKHELEGEVLGPLEISSRFVNQLSGEIGCHFKAVSQVGSAIVVTKLQCVGGDDFETTAVLTLLQRKLILVWTDSAEDTLHKEVLERCPKRHP